MFALLDCNNFYVSCERVFSPALEKRPLIVLSSNDGCVIARSEEVKALGIPMGIPVFKIKEQIKDHNIQCFSSNFTLYGDMSRRVIEILENREPHVEVYSIDESFIEFKEDMSREDLIEWGVSTRALIFKWLGLPTRVGFGPTKTLAKLANHWARFEGTFYLDATNQDLLKATPVEKVWGIGRKKAQKLKGLGIHTAFDYREKPDAWLRKHFTVIGLKTAEELRGVSCFLLEEQPEPQKNMVVSRSFAEATRDFEQLKTYVSLFAARAAEKLRHRHQKAAFMTVYIRTSPHRENYFSNALTVPFLAPTNDTQAFLKQAEGALKAIFKKGPLYKKAAIYLTGLEQEWRQGDLFFKTTNESPALMQALDAINDRYGKGTLRFGSCGSASTKLSAVAKHENLSPPYTTSWQHLLTVK